MASSTGDVPDTFDFNQEINRHEVPSLKYSSLVLGNDDDNDLFVAGVADMDFAVAPCIQSAIQQRCQHAILGYEKVPPGLYPAVCDWMQRHHYKQQLPEDDSNDSPLPQPLHFLRAPNVLNSLAMTLQSFTQPGDGIIVQPPVFFDFFDIIAENKRTLVENPLLFDGCRYTMDLPHLNEVAAEAKILFLCNPHNPIGRVWARKELQGHGFVRVNIACPRRKLDSALDRLHDAVSRLQ
jgi:cystathionine beta-lyase